MGRLAYIGAQSFRQAGAHPVQAGISGAVVERNNGNRRYGTLHRIAGFGPMVGGIADSKAGTDSQHEGGGSYRNPLPGKLPGWDGAGRDVRRQGRLARGRLLALPDFQLVDQLLERGEARIGIALQTLADHIAQYRRNRRIHVRQWDRGFLRAFHQAGDSAVRVKGNKAAQHLIKDEPYGKLVRTCIQVLPHGLLGRHILHGSDHHAGLGHAVTLHRSRQTEVHDYDAAGGVAHDIAGLEIAMDDALAMGGLQAGADLQHDADRFVRWHSALARKNRAQVLTFDELHGDELHAVSFVQIVNANDVLMSDLAGKHQLLLEASEDGGISGEVRANYLEAGDPLDFYVAGFVDGAHAAHAE